MHDLGVINEKLGEVQIHNKKIEDFIWRIGYYKTYYVPVLEQFKEYEDHYHGESLMLINKDYVSLLETMNGHLDVVVDTTAMDSIE